MNIMYCGDRNIIDGLIISILSLLKKNDNNFNFYIITMKYKDYKPITQNEINKLEKVIKKYNKKNNIYLIDITTIFNEHIPINNLNTRFTPYCMLRLYSDLLNLPDKILYLDNDVVANKDINNLYNTNIENFEICGALDRYGKYFYHYNGLKIDYINSGVLLMNLDLIKKNKTFFKCRDYIINKKSLLPDQAALNKYAKKLIINSKYNEQKKTKNDTVLRHFTTFFKFIPGLNPIKIKPWEIDKVHNILNEYNYDDILNEYLNVKEDLYE